MKNTVSERLFGASDIQMVTMKDFTSIQNLAFIYSKRLFKSPKSEMIKCINFPTSIMEMESKPFSFFSTIDYLSCMHILIHNSQKYIIFEHFSRV